MDEKRIEQILAKDYSVGTERFRDELLARCLDVIGEKDEPQELADEEFEMLAAAGILMAGQDDVPFV